jgi:trigger factor
MSEEQPSGGETSASSVEPLRTEPQPTALKNTVTIEQAGPCKKKVIIEVPEQTIKNATDEQYKSLQKDALVPGFRKGRAPRRLLEKRFGKETTEQVKLKLLADASDLAIKDNKLDILGDPDIDFEKIELPAQGPLKFDFEVEVRPDFDLPQLEGIPVTRTKLETTDDQIDREIKQLRKWSGIWTPREEGAIEPGDQIIGDVVLKVEGAETELVSAEQAGVEQKLDNVEIYVRRNGFVGEIPVEKLDELLVGAGSGETKQTSVEVPKTYFREEYRGKKVDIQITIKDIKWLKPAELDEIFLKRMGAENENELREKTRDTLQSRLEQQTRTEMTQQIYQYLLNNTNFDLPLDLVAEQAATVLKRQYVNLMIRGLSREQIDEQMEQLRASSEEQAKEQLKTFFVMDKVADKLGIDVSDEEINGHIAQLAIHQGQRPERLKEEMDRNGSLAQFRLEIRQSKCIAKLLESAKITEKEPEKKDIGETTKKPAKKMARKAAEDEKKQPKALKTTAKKKTRE